MNKHVRRLDKFGIFCDNNMTEIRGANGTYGVKGYQIFGYTTKDGMKLFKERIWVRYDGSVWPQGSINELIKYNGFKERIN